MTEQEWMECKDPQPMLQFLRGRADNRRLRLLACACARQQWSGLVENEFRRAVEIAEQCADGLGGQKELRAAEEEIWYIGWGVVHGERAANEAATATVEDFAGDAAQNAVACVAHAAPALIREIFGNPFRAVRDTTDWLPASDKHILDLARTIYENHDFGEMPRLSEFLKQVGCPDEELLAHLACPTSHFRGCWALDVILGHRPEAGAVTVAGWLEEVHPFYMLTWWRYLRGEPSDRKRRLLACASCRLAWPVFTDECLSRAVALAEAFADDAADTAELDAAAEAAHALGLARGEILSTMRRDQPGQPALANAWNAAHAVAYAANRDSSWFGNAMHHSAQDGGRGRDTVDAGQAQLVREILGSPIGTVRCDPAWLTPTVVALAESTYHDRAFGRMPILGDALEDAGCNSQDVLSHCRGPGPHVRGCWVVDLLLRKE